MMDMSLANHYMDLNHAKTAIIEEPELKEHTPIRAIEEIKGKRSSREGKNASKEHSNNLQEMDQETIHKIG